MNPVIPGLTRIQKPESSQANNGALECGFRLADWKQLIEVKP